MKIVYFNYEWDLRASTGAATQLEQTVKGLKRLGHQVLVVDRHRKPPNWSHGRRQWLHGWLWETANHWRSLRGVGPEMDVLRRERPDVVLTLHALRFSSLLAARRLGIPVVLQVNAPVPHEIRCYRPELRLLPRISDWVERRMLQAADGVIVVSNALRDHLARRGAEPAKITVIPNGADVQLFRPEAAEPAIRARFPGQILVGFAGSFARFHGLELLEQAIDHISCRQPGVQFVLVGGGPGADQLRGRCRRLGCDGQVMFLGALAHNQMPGVLAAMDVLVAPYASQDFFYFSPIKLFEYMASGRAVVAARLGQIAEVIEHGRNGLLYDPADPGDFIEKLLELVRDPACRARLGAKARRTIAAGYTWDHNIRLVAEALERAAGLGEPASCEEHTAPRRARRAC
ncbi:MAG TPA: glycosyltransferase family 4 protein [Bryobacterales bacterium]|nr:glycosyltransferase family 4 protein [Bryobacterales bacterium]